MKTKIEIKILIITFIFLFTTSVKSQTEITLKKSFIESLKDKITMTIDYSIDASNYKNVALYPDYYSPRGQTYKSSRNISDLIIAGRNEDIGLPVVAKIYNAKNDLKAVEYINGNENSKIKLTGVWRIWCNYIGNDSFIQGKYDKSSTDYNPKHVFELSPVLKTGKINLNGYNDLINTHRLFDAETAIGSYTNAKCRIKIDDSMVTLITQGVVSDYAEFILQINDLPEIKKDGRIVVCNVFGDNDNLLFSNLKMVFFKDSEPEKTISKLSKGDKLRVLGIPRINLDEIDSRIKNSEMNKDLLNGNLPFEMVILSVLKN